ncbi:hypothetical protein DICVIV_04641 [Dictyocaulus viviparus]|uniref:Uncharacterized protein n=1 Tax=Dictyocaulus viviparus TaxID=29172 RepID=A0A0D8Y3S5_DICVI|nr:hypothetical protein DICVIV_04641 [Dictyocaulus viviparus]
MDCALRAYGAFVLWMHLVVYLLFKYIYRGNVDQFQIDKYSKELCRRRGKNSAMNPGKVNNMTKGATKQKDKAMTKKFPIMKKRKNEKKLNDTQKEETVNSGKRIEEESDYETSRHGSYALVLDKILRSHKRSIEEHIGLMEKNNTYTEEESQSHDDHKNDDNKNHNVASFKNQKLYGGSSTENTALIVG